MKAVLENPYRIVGLLVGASAKEKERKVRRLKQFIEAGYEPEADDSFSEKIPVVRTGEIVSEADSKLNLDSDRMSAALFWFYNGNEVKDTMAFEAMKDCNFDQAELVWKKLASSEITKTNASAYSNLATLYLGGFMGSALKKVALYEKGIPLKLKFLESEYARDLKQKATDETYKATNKEMQLMFLQAIHDEIAKGKAGITLDMFLLIIMELSFSAKDEFLRSFVQKPLDQIERKISETKAKRKEKPANAIEAAKSLLKDTKDSLSQLEFVLKTTDFRYTDVKDNIAEEVLQCGIDYFNLHREKSENISGPKSAKEDFAKVALEICEKAASIAVGKKVKNRCNENVDIMKGFIDQRGMLEPIMKLKELIDKYDRLAQTIDNARQLVSNAKPLLRIFKSAAGSNKELSDIYIQTSTRVASDALSMCIAEFNKLQENLGNIELLKRKLNEAIDVMKQIESMDLQYDFRNNRLKENKKTLEELKNLLDKPQAPQPGHAEIEQLKNLIDEYDRRSQTVSNAKQYLSEAKYKLQKVRTAFGASSEIFMALSTRIASDALGMCISEINSAQGRINSRYDLDDFKTLLDKAIDVMIEIGKMDMLEKQRQHFKDNLEAINKLYRQLSSGSSGSSSSSGSSGSSGPCYIATMAYGDYDHPQVMVLRDFRDRRLKKSVPGQWFVRNYYRYSPQLVEALKNNKTVNRFIRMLLDQLIKLIK